MPKFEPKSSPHATLMDFIKQQEKDFWETHKVIETKYHITRSQYSYEDDYGSTVWISQKDLYGPYDTKEDAQEHIDQINADKTLKANLSADQGELFVREARLVETTVTKQFWI